MSVLMFEPGRFFPQCHASCLLPLEEGRLICAYFAGTKERADDVGIWLSEFDGARWLDPRLIAKLSDEPHWNPVLFAVRDGIRLVFKTGREIAHWRSWTMFSADGGRMWSQPHPYVGNPAGGPVRSKPIRLASGELLAPNSDEDGPWTPRVDVSSDEGESFVQRARIPVNLTDADRHDYIPGRGAIQPTLWESRPGCVHALLRTSAGRIFRSDSVDGGRTWMQARPLLVPNNNSGIDAVRTEDGRIFLALNPTSGDFVQRTPLCIYQSLDNGESFSPYAVVNDQPLNEFTGQTAEFSYPSLVYREGVLYLSYTYNRRAIAFWTQRTAAPCT